MNGRVVACDDGIVRKLGWGSGFTLVSCILWSLEGGGPVTAALAPVRVDGLDATDVIAGLVEVLQAPRSPLIVDSVTIAGFNVVNPYGIVESVGSPVVYVYKYMPSLERLLGGLEKARLPLTKVRARVIEAVVSSVKPAETRRGIVYLGVVGMQFDVAVKLVEKLQVYSRTPEPLRIAHYTASEASLLLYPS